MQVECNGINIKSDSAYPDMSEFHGNAYIYIPLSHLIKQVVWDKVVESVASFIYYVRLKIDIFKILNMLKIDVTFVIVRELDPLDIESIIRINALIIL